MCNKTWLMFYCRRDEHDNYFKTRTVRTVNVQFFYKRYIFTLNPRLQKISKFNQRIKTSIFKTFIHFPCLPVFCVNRYTR